VDRGIAQHAAAGQKRGVKNQDKRGDDQRKGRAQAGAAFLPQHHAVQRGHQHEPGNVHGVLDRVPVPVAAEIQGFVGPVGPHHHAHAQHAAADERPGQSRFYPSGKLALPKGSDGEGKRHQRQGEAQEQRGRVNHHPVVLEQGVEASAILGHEVGVHLEHRQVGEEVAEQDKRGRTHLHPAQHHAQNHAHQKQLHAAEYGHHGGFPLAVEAHDAETQHHLPENPEQKRAFLTFPETGNHVLHRQVVRAVAPGVIILVAVRVNDVEQAHNHRHDGRAVHEKRPAPQPQPARVFVAQRPAP